MSIFTRNIFSSRILLSKPVNYLRNRGSVYNVTEIYNPFKPSISKDTELIKHLKEQIQFGLGPKLIKKMRIAKEYFRLEMSAPSQGEIQQLISDVKIAVAFISNGCFMDITVKQAWLLFLVGLEIYLWFFFGETIGKGHIVGYKV